METVIKRLYEGLFLVDSGEATSDWKSVIGAIEKMVLRADGEVVSINKWDERSLAYDVNGKNRGTYILTYFHADPDKIATIERDVQLSEQFMRTMILRADQMNAEDIDRPTPAMVVEEAKAKSEAKAEAQATAQPAEESANSTKETAPVDSEAEPSEETETAQSGEKGEEEVAEPTEETSVPEEEKTAE